MYRVDKNTAAHPGCVNESCPRRKNFREFFSFKFFADILCKIYCLPTSLDCIRYIAYVALDTRYCLMMQDTESDSLRFVIHSTAAISVINGAAAVGKRNDVTCTRDKLHQ
jgi:hypothetical protein